MSSGLPDGDSGRLPPIQLGGLPPPTLPPIGEAIRSSGQDASGMQWEATGAYPNPSGEMFGALDNSSGTPRRGRGNSRSQSIKPEEGPFRSPHAAFDGGFFPRTPSSAHGSTFPLPSIMHAAPDYNSTYDRTAFLQKSEPTTPVPLDLKANETLEPSPEKKAGESGDDDDDQVDLQADETLEPSPPREDQGQDEDDSDKPRGQVRRGVVGGRKGAESPPRRSMRAKPRGGARVSSSGRVSKASRRRDDDESEDEDLPLIPAKRRQAPARSADWDEAEEAEVGGKRRTRGVAQDDAEAFEPATRRTGRNSRRRRRDSSEDDSEASVAEKESAMAASSQRRRPQRFVHGITVLFNMSNEPCLKYSLAVVGDRGVARPLYASSRLRKESMYIETPERKRYELSFHSVSGVQSYRWAECKNATKPVHVAPLDITELEVIAADLQWEEVHWGAVTLQVRDQIYKPTGVFWRPLLPSGSCCNQHVS